MPSASDLHSPDPERRGRAMQALASRVKTDASCHAEALPIFHATILHETDPWALLSAAHGLETILGADRAYLAWLSLLNHPKANIVAAAVRAVTDRRYVLPLIDVLHQRTENSIRQSTIRALGRLRDPAIFPALLPFLAHPELRPHTIEALGDLGDVRAYPHLEALAHDPTAAWPEDNHGPMLRVGDLVRRALARFQVAEPPAPPPSNFAAFLPLLAAVVQCGTTLILVIALANRYPGRSFLNYDDLLGFIALLPALSGLGYGLVVVAPRFATLRPSAQLSLAGGLALCTLFVAAFGYARFS